MNTNILLENHDFLPNVTKLPAFIQKEQFQKCCNMSEKWHVSTCSLTEARMAEVVSVSEPSPLEVVRPGLKELVFSEADEGWSGTGIAPAMQDNTLNGTGCCPCKQI